MTTTTLPVIVGIDLGKHWFHLVGLDGRGAQLPTTSHERQDRPKDHRLPHRHVLPGARSRPLHCDRDFDPFEEFLELEVVHPGGTARSPRP